MAYLVMQTFPEHMEQLVGMKSSKEFQANIDSREMKLLGSASDCVFDLARSCQHDCCAYTSLYISDSF